MNEHSLDVQKGPKVGDELTGTLLRVAKPQTVDRQEHPEAPGSSAFCWQFVHAAFLSHGQIRLLCDQPCSHLFLWAWLLVSGMLLSNTLKGHLRSSRE